MCDIKEEIEETTATGYKFVIKKRGRFYSPSTGIEYKLGKMPNIRKSRPMADGCWVDPFDKIAAIGVFEPRMKGNTAIFEEEYLCRDIGFRCGNSRYPYVIIKITLSKVKYIGSFAGGKTFIGSVIESIEEVE